METLPYIITDISKRIDEQKVQSTGSNLQRTKKTTTHEYYTRRL